MGQQCAKENQTKSSPNAPVVELDLKQSRGTSALQSGFRSYLSHPSVDELLSRLSQSQVLSLLDQFRSKCQAERNLLMQYGNDKKTPKTHKKSWKRLFLKDVSLLPMFESLQQVNYANYIKDALSVSQPKTGDTGSGSKLYAWVDDLTLLDDSALLKAFHIIHYLFNSEGIENNSVRDEVIFQDFCALFSICLHGTREEMLILMFLQFADTVDPLAGKTGDRESKKYGLFGGGSSSSSSANKANSAAKTDTPIKAPAGRGRSLTDPENATSVAGSRSHVSVLPDSAAAAPFGAETRTRRSSFDNPAAAPVSTTAAAAGGGSGGVKPSPSKAAGSGKHASVDSSRGSAQQPLQHASNRLLSRLMLSEAAVFRFMLFYLLCFQSSSYLRDRHSAAEFNSSSNEEEPHPVPADTFREVLTDLLTRLAQHSKAAAGPSAATALSFRSFLALMHDWPPASEDNHSTASNSHNGSPVSFVASGVASLTLSKLIRPTSSAAGAGAVLNTSTESLRRVLYVFVNDLVKNPYKILHSALDCFESDASHARLPATLSLFGEGNTKPVVNKSLPDYQVFLMETKWFYSWCDCMDVLPVMASKWSPGLGCLLAELQPRMRPQESEGVSRDTPVTPTTSESQWKYRRLGAFDDPPSGLMRLRNSRLLQKTALGLLEVRHHNIEGAFVALPFALGSLLYNHYDPQASLIPAATYQRRLNFCSSSVPPQEILQQPIKNGVQTFVSNFYASNSVFLDVHPLLVPIFYCNASGLANPQHSDLLKVFHNPQGLTVLNAEAAARMTARDLISGQLLGNKIHSIRLSDVRLWGLYQSDKTRLSIAPSPVSDVLCHSADCEWRLLTKNDSDYERDLFPLFGARHGNNGSTNGVSDSRGQSHCLGVMLEFRNEASVWPTARVTPLAYAKQQRVAASSSSTIVTSSSHIELGTSGSETKLNLPAAVTNAVPSSSSGDIYRIGQLVDVLSDANTYCSGEVIAISKEVAADFSTRMLLTVRLVSSDLTSAAASGASPVVKSILKVKAATATATATAAVNGAAVAATAVPNDVVILPYFSPRVLPQGSVTGLYSPAHSSDQSSSTLPHALTLLAPLINLTDAFARQANLLKNQHVGTSRTVLTLRRKTSLGHTTKMDPFSALAAATNPTMASTQKTTTNEEDENDQEEDQEERNLDNFQVPADYELSKDNSKTSLQSEGIKTPTSNGTTATARNVGIMFGGNKSGTVIPLPQQQQQQQEAESTPILSPTSVDAAAGLLMSPTNEMESADATPVTTGSADAGMLFSILAREGSRTPSFVRLLYAIAKSESRLVNTPSSDIKAVDLEQELFTLPDKPTAATTTIKSLLSAEMSDDMLSVNSNEPAAANDGNHSVTDGTDNTDASNALNNQPGGVSAASRKGPKKFGPKNIARACSSISRLLGGKQRGGGGGDGGKTGGGRNGAAAGAAYSTSRGAVENSQTGVELSSSTSTTAINTANSSANTRSKSPLTVGGAAGAVVAGGDVVSVGVPTTIGLTGLNNCGNTCFLSSALQCLTKTPMFVLYFLTQQYQFDLNTTNNLGSKGKLTKEFAKFLFTIYNLNAAPAPEGSLSLFGGSKTSKAKQNQPVSAALKYDSMSPIALIKSFQAHKPSFSGADQQDAQEFLAELLDTFHEDLKLKPVSVTATITAAAPAVTASKPATESAPMTANASEKAVSVDSMSGQELNIDKILQQGRLAWNKYVSSNDSIISSMFQGQLCNKVTCKVCNTVSVKFEPFTTLSLSIPKMMSGTNSNGTSETITIVATVYRKMPHLLLMQKYIALCRATQGDDGTDGVINLKDLQQYIMLCRKPVRIAVTVARHGTMLDVKQKVCEALNAVDHPMTAEEEANHFNNNASSREAANGATAAAAPLDMSRLPLLSPMNVTAVDVNGEERGKIRKILENKETISSFVDDVQSDFSMIVLENNKNIPFISQLPAARLMPSVNKSKKTTLDPSKDWRPLVLEYTDEMEYNAGHAMHNNDPAFEGRILGDIDYIYDKDTITAHHPLFVQAKTPSAAAGAGSAGVTCSGASAASGSMPRKNSVSSVDSSASRAGAVKFNNSLVWPSTLDQFVIGTRVDALDHKGCWFSGSIIDVFEVTESDIRSAGLTKHARETSKTGTKPAASSAAAATAGGSQAPRQKLLPGCHVRVHFDSFSSIWDEWYDQRDYEAGFIFPVYVKTQRKLKIFDIQVIQRRLVPDKAVDIQGEEGSLSPDASRVIDIFDMPIILQSESYRSLFHVHKIICEQMVRFMNEEQISRLIQCQETGQEFKWPFNVRILSSNNIQAPPLDTSSGAGEDDNNECRKRFFDFKIWEGSPFPQDKNRPLVNLFHSRIIFAVDWFNTLEDKFPIVRLEDQSAMLYVKRSLYPQDSESFQKYVQYIQQKQQQLLATQVVNSPTSAASEAAAAEPNQPFKDTRVGLTLEHLLSKFVGVEQIDEYFCDCCKKLCPGVMHTSIHMLPDVLMLHLKRLVMNATSGGKIRTLVKFPLLDLNMSPYMTENLSAVKDSADENDHLASATTLPSLPSVASIDSVASCASDGPQHHFELYGVVNHLGGMYGGHYVAMAKCEQIVVPAPASSNISCAPTNATTTAAGGGVPGASPVTVREDEEDNSEATAAENRTTSNNSMRTPIAFQDYVFAHGGGAVQPVTTKKWLKFDDEFVLEVSNTNNPIETSICTESAYLLFYQKKVLSNKNLMKYL